MTKLFPRVFASIPDDVKVDDELHEKMALIQQFIRPENLDIQPTFQNETSWLVSVHINAHNWKLLWYVEFLFLSMVHLKDICWNYSQLTHADST